MSKTLQEMQIEVARYWAGVEEMKDCYWELLTDGKSVKPDEVRLSNIDFETIGPYLKIEDGNPWSSAAILARAGYKVEWHEGNWGIALQEAYYGDMWNPKGALGDFDPSWQELANNRGLQWLHKYAPEVWAKGMEALR